MQNVENIRAMFCKCINLKDIPDFDKYKLNLNRLKKMRIIFETIMSLLFYLTSFPKLLIDALIMVY